MGGFNSSTTAGCIEPEADLSKIVSVITDVYKYNIDYYFSFFEFFYALYPLGQLPFDLDLVCDCRYWMLLVDWCCWPRHPCSRGPDLSGFLTRPAVRDSKS